MSSGLPLQPLHNVKSLTFDLMGTCADWHTSILNLLKTLPPIPSNPNLSQLASDWRESFFQAIFDSFERGEQSPGIDIVHRQVLDKLLKDRGIDERIWGEDVRRKLVDGWHHQLG